MQDQTKCCTGQCNQGRACVMHTTSGGMTSGGTHSAVQGDADFDVLPWYDKYANLYCITIVCIAAVACAWFIGIGSSFAVWFLNNFWSVKL